MMFLLMSDVCTMVVNFSSPSPSVDATIEARYMLEPQHDITLGKPVIPMLSR